MQILSPLLLLQKLFLEITIYCKIKNIGSDYKFALYQKSIG